MEVGHLVTAAAFVEVVDVLGHQGETTALPEGGRLPGGDGPVGGVRLHGRQQFPERAVEGPEGSQGTGQGVDVVQGLDVAIGVQATRAPW